MLLMKFSDFIIPTAYIDTLLCNILLNVQCKTSSISCRRLFTHANFLHVLIALQIKKKTKKKQINRSIKNMFISGWAGPDANSYLIIGKLGFLTRAISRPISNLLINLSSLEATNKVARRKFKHLEILL